MKQKIIILMIIILLITFKIFININTNKQNKTPNEPYLIKGMIPVLYKEGNWITTDKSNNWYNYDKGEWANIVFIKDEEKTKYYDNAEIGTIIELNDILAFYVWIPRYKYKVFNINKQSNYDFYNAKEKGIEIIFEENKNKTGTINCNYNFNKLLKTNNETCIGTNGNWYTHPAFTLGDIELSGIWVSKFEVTGTEDNPTILPNESALRNQTVSNQFNTAKKIIEKSYIDQENSHMMKNMEWGAVAYLSHSKYGICKDNNCEEMEINNNDSFISGTIIIDDNEYQYDTSIGVKLSTTGNVTGIYDMSGGSSEYVMANISKTKNIFTLNQISYSEFNNNWLKTNYKYIDTYAYNDILYGNKTNYITKLGDAMGETIGWFDDNKWAANTESSWIERGGNYSMGKTAGIFAYAGNMGYNTRMNGFRSVIVK